MKVNLALWWTAINRTCCSLNKKKNLPSFPRERPPALLHSEMYAVNHQLQWQLMVNYYHVEWIITLKHQRLVSAMITTRTITRSLYLWINICLAAENKLDLFHRHDRPSPASVRRDSCEAPRCKGKLRLMFFLCKNTYNYLRNGRKHPSSSDHSSTR